MRLSKGDLKGFSNAQLLSGYGKELKSQLKKLQQQQLIANKKRDELLKNEKEKKDFENRKTEYISKFGQQYGELIANYKVKIGMTSEMCKYAWGLPIWTNKITSENGTIEVWHCGSGYKLYFTNNILKIIEE